MSLTAVQKIAKKFIDGNAIHDSVEFYNNNIIFVFDKDYPTENNKVNSHFLISKETFNEFNPEYSTDYHDIKRFDNVYNRVSSSLLYGGFESVKEPVYCESKSSDDFWVFECEINMSK
jgi:hypothetical protein